MKISNILFLLVLLINFSVLASGVRDAFDVIRTPNIVPSGIVRFYESDNVIAKPRMVIGWINNIPYSLNNFMDYNNNGVIQQNFTLYGIKFTIQARVGVGGYLGGTISGLMDGGFDETSSANWTPISIIAQPDDVNLVDVPRGTLNLLSSEYAQRVVGNPNITLDAVNFGQLYSVYANSLRAIYQFDDSGKRGISKLTFGHGKDSTVYIQGKPDESFIRFNPNSKIIGLDIISRDGFINIKGSGSSTILDDDGIRLKSFKYHNNALLEIKNTVYDNIINLDTNSIELIVGINTNIQLKLKDSNINITSIESGSLFKYDNNQKRITIGDDSKINQSYIDLNLFNSNVYIYGGNIIYLNPREYIDGSRKRIVNIDRASLLEDDIRTFGPGALNAEQIPRITAEHPLSVQTRIENNIPYYNITYTKEPEEPPQIELKGPQLVGIIHCLVGDYQKGVSWGWQPFMGRGSGSLIKQKIDNKNFRIIAWRLYRQLFNASTRLRVLNVSINDDYIASVTPARINVYEIKGGKPGNRDLYRQFTGVAIVPRERYNRNNFIVTLHNLSADSNIDRALLQQRIGFGSSVNTDEDEDDSDNEAADMNPIWADRIFGSRVQFYINGVPIDLPDQSINDTSINPILNQNVKVKFNDSGFSFSVDDIRPLIIPNVVSNYFGFKIGNKKQTNMIEFINCEYANSQNSIDIIPNNGFAILPTKQSSIGDKVTMIAMNIYYIPALVRHTPKLSILNMIINDGIPTSLTRKVLVKFEHNFPSDDMVTYELARSSDFTVGKKFGNLPSGGIVEYTNFPNVANTYTLYGRLYDKNNINNKSPISVANVTLVSPSQPIIYFSASPITSSIPFDVSLVAQAAYPNFIEPIGYRWLTNNVVVAITTYNTHNIRINEEGNYSFRVIAYTNNTSGTTITSSVINVYAYEERMDAPDIISVKKFNRTTAKITWDKIRITNKSLQFMVVRFSSMNNLPPPRFYDGKTFSPGNNIVYNNATIGKVIDIVKITDETTKDNSVEANQTYYYAIFIYDPIKRKVSNMSNITPYIHR